MRSWYAQISLGAAALAFLAASAAIAQADTITVDVKSNFFSPANVSINTGDTVRWVVDNGTHTTTSKDGLWDSGLISNGAMFEYTFNNAGDFAYICSLHFDCCNMAGTVHVSKPKRVRPSPQPEPEPSPSPLPPHAPPPFLDRDLLSQAGVHSVNCWYLNVRQPYLRRLEFDLPLE